VAGAVSSRTALGTRGQIGFSHTSKDFGANGFYGAAPSHERPHQTLAHATGALGTVSGWALQGAASYRTHGDHFVFDVRRPALSDNRHRSHTLLGTLRATRSVGRGTVTFGGEGAGDWLRSTNLGDRSLARVSAFGEVRYALRPTVQADLSVRVDRYNEFGVSGNPGGGVSWWITPRVRARAAGSRAFRVPTFTERYYRDPANQARAEVGPETSWGGDGGVDVFVSPTWLVQAGGFARRDRDVIDWLRPTPSDLWRTFNVHRVRTTGMELAVRRVWAGGAFVQGGYTHVSLSAATASTLCGAPTCLSKYVLDYAPDVLTAAALVPLPGGVRVAPRLEYKRRRRNATTTDYALVDLRVTRRFAGIYELRVEGTNLGNVVYQEIAGVAMPGRAGTVALTIGR
jgi:iron complex outermembrane receptor protein